MGARVSAEMRLALQYVQDGKSTYQAAALAGISPSALYKALKTQAKKKLPKPLDNSVA
jgi:DNA-binding phage protein